jgi:heme/copper-type cytochrome/quinol oxidase subunit 3
MTAQPIPHAQAIAHAHPPTATGLNTWKVGFWTFMGSETLFFGTLISTYMVYKGQSVNGPFSQELLNIPITSVSTFVLLMSSLAVVLALGFLQEGKRGLALFWTMAIIVLGATFLGFQAYEFTQFHGAHVTVGVIWLLILWIDMLRGRLLPHHSLRLEIAGLYWHFVDIVWIVIFTLIYLIE